MTPVIVVNLRPVVPGSCAPAPQRISVALAVSSERCTSGQPLRSGAHRVSVGRGPDLGGGADHRVVAHVGDLGGRRARRGRVVDRVQRQRRARRQSVSRAGQAVVHAVHVVPRAGRAAVERRAGRVVHLRRSATSAEGAGGRGDWKRMPHSRGREPGPAKAQTCAPPWRSAKLCAARLVFRAGRARAAAVERGHGVEEALAGFWEGRSRRRALWQAAPLRSAFFDEQLNS